MHFSQQASRLERTHHAEHTLLRVRALGFVTADMVQQAATEACAASASDEVHPKLVLVDLRDAMGYGAGCAVAAQGWLARAVAGGACRVAFVARSSVVRTAGQMLAAGLDADLRFFEHGSAACAWLGVPAPLGQRGGHSEPEGRPSEARAS